MPIMSQSVYVTCAIPYVNAPPHIGHALEYVQGDVIARYHRLLGKKTILLSGGDENALKNVRAAEKAGIPVQQFIDKNTNKFLELTRALGCTFDIWQKGSDTKHHYPASQKLWLLCEKAGDIYKKAYEGLYCVGCESFYEPEELNAHGECPEHPGKKLETVKEENYFFRLSKYQKQITHLISSDTLRIIPETRKNEVLSFLKQPLRDISISRSNERARNWGVPVPGDNTQRMYVWFDALNIYQSGIGFGWNDEQYNTWWPADVHVIGKGISRFHAVYWPAFLLSAGLKTPASIFVHGYFTVNGHKMSKTLGNVIDPFVLIKKYSADALRYYFLREIPPFADGDFSERRFKELYNADLANELGNLLSRTARLCERIPEEFPPTETEVYDHVQRSMQEYRFDQALQAIWTKISALNEDISKEKPWNSQGRALSLLLKPKVNEIRNIGYNLKFLLPDTAGKILRQFTGPTIRSGDILFPRLS